MINSGFIGFNAVLAAVATYELVAADLRLTVWGIMLLGWLNPRFRPDPAPSEPEAPVPVPASGDAPS